MASLGSLNFNIHFKDDPKELEEIKKRALEQLKDLEVKFNISATVGKEDITKEITEILERERKLNVTVDKEKISKDIQDATNVESQTAAYKDMESAINSIIGTRGQNIKRLTEEKNALADVQSQLKIYEKQQQWGATLTKEQSANKEKLINREFEHKQAIAELNQLLRADVKVSQSANTSMNEMSQTLGRMKTAYRELNKEMRDSPFGQQLKAQIGALDKEMKNLDAGIGNHQRNVGNYKMAWNGLQFQVQQVARELPSIAYGANIFFAAISNNIPMLQDEIKRAKFEYKKLREEQAKGINLNKKAVPVWKQIAQSVFSWQTALVLALTVLTIYGQKIVSAIGKMLDFKDAAKLTKKEIKDLNDAFSQSVGREMAKLDELFDKLSKATEGTAEWHKAKADIINQYGEQLSGMRQEITAIEDQSAAYRVLTEAIYAKAKADAIQGEIAKLGVKRVDEESKIYDKMLKTLTTKYGKDEGTSMLNQIQRDLVTTGELSEEVSNKIKKDFDKQDVFFNEGSGWFLEAETVVNPVMKFVEKLNDEADEFNSKVDQLKSRFSYIGNLTKDVSKNEEYWRSQKNALEAHLKGLTAEQAAGEEGLELKKKITAINKTLEAYEVEREKNSKKSNDPLKERLGMLGKGFSLYSEWIKLVGKEEAKGIAQSVFPEFDPDTYRKDVQKILDTSKVKDTRIEAAQILTGLNKGNIENQLADVEKYISDTVRKWDLFSDLFKKTGDYNFSVNAAFGGDIAFSSILEQLRTDIEKETSKSGISFDQLIGLSPEEIESQFGGVTAALVKMYREQNRKIKEESLKNVAELLNTFRNYEKQREDIIKEGEQNVADLISNGASQDAIDEANKRTRQALASLDFKEFKETDLWAKAFEDIDRLSTETVDNIIEKLEEFQQTTAENLPINELKELMRVLLKLRSESEKRNPFKALADGLKELGDAKTSDDIQAAKDKINDAIGGIIPYADALSDALGSLKDVFDSFGNESMSDVLGTAQSVLGGVSSMAMGVGGLMSGNPLKMAQGAANVLSGITNIVGSIAAAHDKKLDRAIERSQLEVQKLQDLYSYLETQLERFLGDTREFKPLDLQEDEKRLKYISSKLRRIKSGKNITMFDLKNLSKYSKEVDKLQKRLDAFNKRGAYGYQQQLLKEQLAQIEKQRKAEERKGKHKSKKKLADYDAQIKELKDQIAGFAEELANTLYGIDLKGWANQLGDALYDAWKKGEDGAEAFKRKAAEIMGDVMNEILKTQIILPQMQKMSEYLFGKDGESGAFGTDYKLDESEIKKASDMLMGIAGKSDAYYEMLDNLDKYMKDQYGVSLKESTGGKGLSAGIKGITEDTANILASYLNATRADVNQQLQQIREFMNSDVPEMHTIAKAQLNQLKTIASNTGRSADKTEEIMSLLNAFASGSKKLNVK